MKQSHQRLRERWQWFKIVCVVSVAIALIAIPTNAEYQELEDADGNRYVGDTLNDVPHGFGTYIWSDGRTYEGSFREGEIQGIGRQTMEDGSTYEGSFVNGGWQGYGLLTEPDGDTYTGTFVNGRQTGQGTWVSHSNNMSYSGQFLDSKFHGIGRLEHEDGYSYEGGFWKGDRSGFGQEETAEGHIYRGFFAANQRHGDGVLVSGNELRFQTFDNGELVINEVIKEVENCQLELLDRSWMFQSDDCIDEMAHGEGRAVALDGSAYISFGVFVLGRFTEGVVIELNLPETNN